MTMTIDGKQSLATGPAIEVSSRTPARRLLGVMGNGREGDGGRRRGRKRPPRLGALALTRSRRCLSCARPSAGRRAGRDTLNAATVLGQSKSCFRPRSTPPAMIDSCA